VEHKEVKMLKVKCDICGEWYTKKELTSYRDGTVACEWCTEGARKY
jgi:formylmethanofuran dehydrogenase subunit E